MTSNTLITGLAKTLSSLGNVWLIAFIENNEM